MPELPEVETVKNSLIELIIGKRIESVDIYYDKIIKNVTNSEFSEELIGEEFIDIKRRGKYLIFILKHHAIISHLRMEGKYFLKGREEKEKHEHIIFNLENNESLRYNDTRKFGVMYLYNTTDLDILLNSEPLNKLGYEPFDEKCTPLYLYNRLKSYKGEIKKALLDQEIMVGLGNIYVDEVLFISKIHPEEKTSKLNLDDYKNIIESSRITLNKAIKLGGTTIKSFVNSHMATGLFQNELLVHTKEICPECKGKIEKIRVGGRGTYYCPNCQKMKS